MASSDLTALSGYTASYTQYDPTERPPPAPPKPTRPSHSASLDARAASQIGPPLPPPPPSHSSTPPSQASPQLPRAQSEHSQRQLQSPPSQPPPPGQTWLPSTLQDKTYQLPPCTPSNLPIAYPYPLHNTFNSVYSTQQLAPLLSSPTHLRALAQTHPSLHPSNSPLPPLLAQTGQLSTQLSQQHARLLHQRDQTQRHLLHLHALERAWRDKQAQLDRELEPWSAKTLYARLREAEKEAETVAEALERSWLDGDGVADEREVLEFLRGYREGRGRVWKRREMRERWDEGRVGGWR